MRRLFNNLYRFWNINIDVMIIYMINMMIIARE